MFHDLEIDGRSQTSASLAGQMVHSSDKVAPWSDESWFALPDSQLGMSTHAPLICGSESADFYLPFESDAAAQLLEHDLPCGNSLGSDSASGNGAYSPTSPYTACSTSPNPLTQAGGSVDWSEYRTSLDRGDPRMHQALCKGALDLNAAVPSQETAREQWPNDVMHPSLFFNWLDDHLSGASDAMYPDGPVFSPDYQGPTEISPSSPIVHGANTRGNGTLKLPGGSLDINSPQPLSQEYPSPVALESWASPDDFHWDRAQHLPVVGHEAGYAGRRGAIVADPYQTSSSPTVVPQNVYPAPDLVPTANLQWNGHLDSAVAPRSWPSRQRVSRTRTPSQPRPTQRTDPRDIFLVQSKLAGMSYREIRDRGKFTEAESTLRGRFRTLTKDKENRVRKPEWKEHDVSRL